MSKRKRYSADFKAKVALEAIREELTLSELSKKYNDHPNMISAWKRTAIENMASGFAKGKEGEQKSNDAEIDRLQAKIGQLVVERDASPGACALHRGHGRHLDITSLCSAGREWRQKTVKHDHPKLRVRRQCTLLLLTRSSLYYQPVGESAENLRFTGIIDKYVSGSFWKHPSMVRDRWPVI